jgi:Mlc titration factor MtfA (ptsG expression regulator)
MAFWRHHGRELPDDVESVMATHLAEWPYLSADERQQVLHGTAELLSSKTWEAAHGFELTDQMCTVIASNAALVVLGLGIDAYRHVRSVIVHPTTITLTGPQPGPVPGLMSDEPTYLLGEAHSNRGPVLLAWDAVRRDTRHRRTGHNVVVHEFVHKLDMLDGMIDGTPPLHDDAELRRWVEVCTAEYRALQEGRGDGLLSDYGATNPGEFFAVAGEVFFDQPVEMAERKPDLYGVLRDYFSQDPAARRPG